MSNAQKQDVISISYTKKNNSEGIIRFLNPIMRSEASSIRNLLNNSGDLIETHTKCWVDYYKFF